MKPSTHRASARRSGDAKGQALGADGADCSHVEYGSLTEGAENMKEDKALLQQAAEHAQKYLDEIGKRPVAATIPPDELRRQLGGKLAEHGEAPAEVINLLARVGQQGTVATQGGRYFGFVVGSSFPVATAVDWLVSGWDQNAGLYVLSPLAAVVEQIAGEWLQTLLGIPASWSVGFVTGGAMANFTALATARHYVLRTTGWDVEVKGLFDAPPVTVVASEDSHYSIATAVRMLGLGADRIRRVPTDAQGRMRAGELSKILNDTTGACIVCAQVGNVNTGAFDPIEAIATETAARGAWLHVDGAFGLWASASPSLRHLAAGIERADSVSTDGHKWLNVPYDCGITFCAHPEAHRHTMMLAAAYIKDTASERDPRAFAPEESRRARAIPVYAVLRTLGPAGVAGLVERCCRHARRFAEGLGAAGYEILNDVVLNQVLVSFGDADKTHRVIAVIQEDGTCWCSGTEWKGRTTMRISVSSWATTDADVERSLEAMLRAARMP